MTAMTASSVSAVPTSAIRCASVATPIGPVWMAGTAEGILRISLRSASRRAFERTLRAEYGPAPITDGSHPSLDTLASQLREYFRGGADPFTSIELDLVGMTPFQRRVLRATAGVPFGRVVPYGAIARAIGSPGASRAVGNALGRNPVPILIPCHRVVASDGTIGGFTGGTDIKRKLLAIEGIAF